jgi:plastocyanin
MRRRLAAIASLLATGTALVLWLAVAPVTSAGDPCYHGFAMPGDTTGAGVRVTLLPCAFAPTVTSAKVGATVTFFNGSDFTHLITGANQSWGSRDTEIAPGNTETVSYTFDKAGVYPYACALHRGMSGVIVVGDAVTSAAGSAGAIAAAGTTGDAAAPSAVRPATSSNATAASTTASQGSEPALIAAVSGLAGAAIGGIVTGLALRRRSAARQDHLAEIA